MGEGGFRFTAFSQLKIVSCEARFVVCGSDLCVWLGLLRFLARPGASGSGAGAGRGGGEGLPSTSLPPPDAQAAYGVGTGHLECCRFFVSALKFCFLFFIVTLKKIFPLVSKSSLQMSGWEISVCMVSGFLLKGSEALVGFYCNFGGEGKPSQSSSSGFKIHFCCRYWGPSGPFSDTWRKCGGNGSSGGRLRGLTLKSWSKKHQKRPNWWGGQGINLLPTALATGGCV